MINILSKETIDKIAAGEVAERPESVVKELLDNAIDSGADTVSIEIRGGGLDLIRITDNGCGIPKDEVRTAFLRHATSKLKTADDLNHLVTMGFRGEALASIAAVSEVEMITRTEDQLTGVRYRIEGGVEKSFQEVGVPAGTTVIVRDFLLNVPVRRQFLKSAQVENSYIVNTVEKLALAHTDISISLTTDGRSIFSSTGNGSLKDVIYMIYGSEAAASLLPVEYELKGIRVSGYAAKPVIARNRRDYEVFFVNGRWIRSDILRKAAEDAYAPFMMQHKYPMLILHVDPAPEAVDVNVHPRKSEVRFASNQNAYDAVFQAVSGALKQNELIVNAGNAFFLKDKPVSSRYAAGKQTAPEPFEKSRKFNYVSSITEEIRKAEEQAGERTPGSASAVVTGGTGADKAGSAAAARTDSPAKSPEAPAPAFTAATPTLKPAETPAPTPAAIPTLTSAPTSAATQTQSPVPAPAPTQAAAPDRSGRNFLKKENVPYFRMIGQVFETYWIIEYNDELFIIDQHAAHEKVNFERFSALIRSHAVESQMLFPPIVLTLGANEAMLLEKYLDDFADLGYEIEYAGDRDYIVRAVPSNLPELGDEEVLRSLIGSLFEDGRGISSELIHDKIASMSCKAAVKGNMKVTEQEMRALIGEMLTLENPYACPHGRPTIIKWSKTDLEKLFKRIVS